MRKRNPRYRTDFESPFLSRAAALLGISFFARVAYYLGIHKSGGGELAFLLILPGLLELGVMILLRGLTADVPVVYGWCSVGYCALLLVDSFFSGSVLVTVLGCLLFLAAGALQVLWLYAIVRTELSGWGQIGAAFAMLAVVVLNVFLSGNITGGISQMIGLFTLAAFGCLILSTTAGKKKEKPTLVAPEAPKL